MYHSFTPEQLKKYERICFARGFIWGGAAVLVILFGGFLILDLFFRALA